MLRVRIVTVDHYMGTPIPDFDVKYSDFRGSVVKQVPVIRIFGITPSGEKACVHVHGVFPYICIPYDGSEPNLKLSYQIAASLDKAINIASGYSTSSTQHVYKVVLVSGIPFYGYHRKKHQYLKIYFYRPSVVKQAANLLQNGAVLNKIFQPHEAHVPFILQFFIDFNLYGMSFLDLQHVRYRKTNFPDLMAAISGELIMSESIPAVSLSQYEVDVSACHILNRPSSQGNGQLSNPGLAAIWDDENRRRAMCEGTPADIPHLHSQRPSQRKTSSELFYLRRLNEILDSTSQSGDESSLSGEVAAPTNRSYAIEEPRNSTALDASFVSLHVSDQPNQSIVRDPLTNAYLDDTIVDEEVALMNLSSSQRLSQSLNRSIVFDNEDLELLDVLETLADTKQATVDDDSILGSQTTRNIAAHSASDVALEEPDSDGENWLDKTIVPEEDEALKLLDLTMPDIDEALILKNYSHATETEAGPSGFNSQIPQVDGTNDVPLVPASEYERCNQFRIPQVDGLHDLPSKPSRKSLGMRGGGASRLTSSIAKKSDVSVDMSQYSSRTGDLIFLKKNKNKPSKPPLQSLMQPLMPPLQPIMPPLQPPIPAFPIVLNSRDEPSSTFQTNTSDGQSAQSASYGSALPTLYVLDDSTGVSSNEIGKMEPSLDGEEAPEVYVEMPSPVSHIISDGQSSAQVFVKDEISPDFMEPYKICLSDDEVRKIQLPVACCSSAAVECSSHGESGFGECAEAFVELLSKKREETVLRGDPSLCPEPSSEKEESVTELMASKDLQMDGPSQEIVSVEMANSCGEKTPCTGAESPSVEGIDGQAEDLNLMTIDGIDLSDFEGFSTCSCNGLSGLSMFNNLLGASPHNETSYSDSEMCRLSGALENGQMEEILQTGNIGNVTVSTNTRSEELLQIISMQKKKVDCQGSCSKARRKSQLPPTTSEDDPVTDELLRRGKKPEKGPPPRLGLGKNMELAKLLCGSPSPDKKGESCSRGKTKKQLRLVKRESRRLKLSITAQIKKNQDSALSSANPCLPNNAKKKKSYQINSGFKYLPPCYLMAGPKLSKENIEDICKKNSVKVPLDTSALEFRHTRSKGRKSWVNVSLPSPTFMPKEDACVWTSPKYKILSSGSSRTSIRKQPLLIEKADDFKAIEVEPRLNRRACTKNVQYQEACATFKRGTRSETKHEKSAVEVNKELIVPPKPAKQPCGRLSKLHDVALPSNHTVMADNRENLKHFKEENRIDDRTCIEQETPAVNIEETTNVEQSSAEFSGCKQSNPQEINESSNKCSIPENIERARIDDGIKVLSEAPVVELDQNINFKPKPGKLSQGQNLKNQDVPLPSSYCDSKRDEASIIDSSVEIVCKEIFVNEEKNINHDTHSANSSRVKKSESDVIPLPSDDETTVERNRKKVGKSGKSDGFPKTHQEVSTFKNNIRISKVESKADKHSHSKKLKDRMLSSLPSPVKSSTIADGTKVQVTEKRLKSKESRQEQKSVTDQTTKVIGNKTTTNLDGTEGTKTKESKQEQKSVTDKTTKLIGINTTAKLDGTEGTKTKESRQEQKSVTDKTTKFVDNKNSTNLDGIEGTKTKESRQEQKSVTDKTTKFIDNKTTKSENFKKKRERRTSEMKSKEAVIEENPSKLLQTFGASQEISSGLQSYKIPKRSSSKDCPKSDLRLGSPLSGTGVMSEDELNKPELRQYFTPNRNSTQDSRSSSNAQTNLDVRGNFSLPIVCNVNTQDKERTKYSTRREERGTRKTEDHHGAQKSWNSSTHSRVCNNTESHLRVEEDERQAEISFGISFETSGNLSLNLSQIQQEENSDMPCFKKSFAKTMSSIPCVDGALTEESSSSSSGSHTSGAVTSNSQLKRKPSENFGQSSNKKGRMDDVFSPSFSKEVKEDNMPKKVKHWFDAQYGPWTFWSPNSSPNARHHSHVFSPPRPVSPDKPCAVNLGGLVAVGHGCMDEAGPSYKTSFEYSQASQDLLVQSQALEIASISTAQEVNQSERDAQKRGHEVVDSNVDRSSEENSNSDISDIFGEKSALNEENSNNEWNHPSSYVTSIPLNASPSNMFKSLKIAFESEEIGCSVEQGSKTSFRESGDLEEKLEHVEISDAVSVPYDEANLNYDSESLDSVSIIHKEANFGGLASSNESSGLQCGQNVGQRNSQERLDACVVPLKVNFGGFKSRSESSDFQCGQNVGHRNPEERLEIHSTFFKPQKKPPSKREVMESLISFNIPSVVNLEPFYSDHADAKGRTEVGGNILDMKSKRCVHLDEFHSSIEELRGLSYQQKRLFEHVWGLSQMKEDFDDLIRNQFDGRNAVIAPVKKPPRVRDVFLWSKVCQIMNIKKNSKLEISYGLEETEESPDQKEDAGTDASFNSVHNTPIVMSSQTENIVQASTPAATCRDSEVRKIPSPLLTPIFLSQPPRHSKMVKRTLTKSKRYLQKLSPCVSTLSTVPEKDEDSIGVALLEPDGEATLLSEVKHNDSLEDLSLRRLLADTQFCREAANPMIRNDSDASACQIKGANSSPGFKMVLENLQSAKTMKEYQYTTMLVLEVHICTCGTLKPDPERDLIRAIFFSVINDVPEDGKLSPSVSGIIAVQSGNSTAPLLNRCAVEGFIKYVADENNLIQELICLVRLWDPDILAGFEIEMLSWGYLLQRACVLGFNLTQELSRIPNVKETKREDDFDDSNGPSGLKVTGRIVLDVWRLFRSEVALQSYTFENLMFHILHQRVSFHSFETLSRWWENPSHLHRWMTVRYYQQRVHGVTRLLDQLDIIGRTSELARLFGIQFFEVLSRGSQFRVESMMLRLAKPLNFIPVSPSVQQRAQMRAPECVPLIMEPESRFYKDPLIVLDFQSLYPSMIIAYNYCFSTCLGRIEHLGKSTHFEFGCSELRISNPHLQHLRDNITVSPSGIAFVTKEVRQGVLPRMLEEILEARLAVKQTMKQNKDDHTLQRVLHARQLGLKLIANVTYGYTSANFSGRMPCIEVGDSVVSKGRETLERAISLVHSNTDWQAKVVYGDTDSLFVLVPGRSRQEAFRIGAEIANAVTQDNPTPVKLKLEKVYHPSILQTKKRYVGFMYESSDQKQPTYEAKGIETVRRDGCPAVAKILEKSLKILFETRNVSSVKHYVRHQFSKILSGQASVQDLIFAREYRGKENYRPGACVPALELTKRWLRHDRRAEPRIGERVPYVVVNGHPGSALIHLVRHPSELLTDTSLRYNAVYYITRVIIPPLSRCLSLLGADVASWYSDLPRKIQPSLPAVTHLGMKKTISQYFTTMECVCCGELTHHGACGKCRSNSQLLVSSLMNKMHNLESTHLAIKKICQSCLGRSQPLECQSLDCPITFRANQASQKYEQSAFITELLSEFCNDSQVQAS